MNRPYRDYCRHMGEAMFQRPIFTEPTLSQEELLAVYQTAKSTDLDILRDTAVQMFPERFQEKPQWNGRAFAVGGSEGYGTCGDEIGVMADGMAYPY